MCIANFFIVNKFCDDMFESLQVAIDSLGPNASLQEISKTFINVIQRVYSRHVESSPLFDGPPCEQPENAGISPENNSLLVDINKAACEMTKVVFEANNKYFRGLYAQLNAQAKDSCLQNSATTQGVRKERRDESNLEVALANIMHQHYGAVMHAVAEHHSKVLAIIGLHSTPSSVFAGNSGDGTSTMTLFKEEESVHL
ncbi:MAG: hypothetical protein LBF66_03275 [Holosporales bacterium]|nr:hypothetical protein [Holosporales bacterium]